MSGVGFTYFYEVIRCRNWVHGGCVNTDNPSAYECANRESPAHELIHLSSYSGVPRGDARSYKGEYNHPIVCSQGLRLNLASIEACEDCQSG